MNRIVTGLTAEEFYRRVDEPTEERIVPRVPFAITYRCENDIYPRKGDWATACAKHGKPTEQCACRTVVPA